MRSRMHAKRMTRGLSHAVLCANLTGSVTAADAAAPAAASATAAAPDDIAAASATAASATAAAPEDIAIATDTGLLTKQHRSNGVITNHYPKRISLGRGGSSNEMCQICLVAEDSGDWVAALGMDLSSITLVGCHAHGGMGLSGRCFNYYCDTSCTRRGACNHANQDHWLASIEDLAKGVGCRFDCCIRAKRCGGCGSVEPKGKAMICARDWHDDEDAYGFYCGKDCAEQGCLRPELIWSSAWPRE